MGLSVKQGFCFFGKSEFVEILPYTVLLGTKHTLCGVHALPGGSPLSGKRTESARAFGQLMWLRPDLIEVSPGHFDPGPGDYS